MAASLHCEIARRFESICLHLLQSEPRYLKFRNLLKIAMLARLLFCAIIVVYYENQKAKHIEFFLHYIFSELEIRKWIATSQYHQAQTIELKSIL